MNKELCNIFWLFILPVLIFSGKILRVTHFIHLWVRSLFCVTTQLFSLLTTLENGCNHRSCCLIKCYYDILLSTDLVNIWGDIQVYSITKTLWDFKFSNFMCGAYNVSHYEELASQQIRAMTRDPQISWVRGS